jgi:hypothetical protein
VTIRFQRKKRGVLVVCEMAGIREGCSCALGEKLKNLTLQCLIRGEETVRVEYLPDSDLLMLFCRNCRGDCPFVFIPLIN